MAEVNLKEIDEYEGMKVNHPHSGANIVYAILRIICKLYNATEFFYVICQYEFSIFSCKLDRTRIKKG